jgi:hypothetical protein
MAGVGDFLSVLSDDEFEEEPCDLRTFITDQKFMKQPPVSDSQYALIERMSQIYKQSTLQKLYGDEAGRRMHKQMVNEVVAQLGKGSGKNFCSIIAVARVVYQLLCLKNPQEYFTKPDGNTIDILNIAINSQQASNIFFNPLRDSIKSSPWFRGKFDDPPRAGEIIFDKHVRAFSGHSEREAWEGYNLILCILDEISGFALNSESGNESAKTAGAIYKMYKASVQSRFPDEGKLVLLSFPRFKGDFIQQRYDAVIAEKHTELVTHKFRLHDDIPEGVEENEFEITYERDHIVSYREPDVYAMRKPSWEVNPQRNIENYKTDFFRDPTDALSRFACMPPDAIDAFFKDRERVEAAFPLRPLPIDSSGFLTEHLEPKEGVDYFIHIDLAYKHDRAALALAHTDSWTRVKVGAALSEPAPVVAIDLVRWWEPKSDKNIDFSEIKDYVLYLRRAGFNIKLVTFDQWQSIEMMHELRRQGMSADRLSVNKQHYTDLALLIYEARLRGYHIDILLDELLSLRIIKGDKVDHPRKGSNDLADAVCGAAYNAAKHSVVETREVDILYLGEQQRKPHVPDYDIKKDNLKPPQEIADWLAKMKVL